MVRETRHVSHSKSVREALLTKDRSKARTKTTVEKIDNHVAVEVGAPKTKENKLPNSKKRKNVQVTKTQDKTSVIKKKKISKTAKGKDPRHPKHLSLQTPPKKLHSRIHSATV
jgi:hypothetical protein